MLGEEYMQYLCNLILRIYNLNFREIMKKKNYSKKQKLSFLEFPIATIKILNVT